MGRLLWALGLQRVNKSKILVASFVLFMFLVGCATNSNKTIIRDYVAGGEYEIVKVDGNPAERKKHSAYVTHVPFVLVTEGTHNLTVRYRKPINFSDKMGEPEEITVDIKKGKNMFLFVKMVFRTSLRVKSIKPKRYAPS